MTFYDKSCFLTKLIEINVNLSFFLLKTRKWDEKNNLVFPYFFYLFFLPHHTQGIFLDLGINFHNCNTFFRRKIFQVISLV